MVRFTTLTISKLGGLCVMALGFLGRSASATMSLDGTIDVDVLTAQFSLPVYDPADIDGSVQLFQYGSESLPIYHDLWCQLTCTAEGSSNPDDEDHDAFIGFSQGRLPTAIGQEDFPSGANVNVSCTSNETISFFMDSTATLYIAIASLTGAGLANASMFCSETFLAVDEILEDEKPSSSFTLSGFDMDNEDATVQNVQFTNDKVEAGTSFECTLDCTTAGTNTEVFAMTTVFRPRDVSNVKLQEVGNCPLTLKTPGLFQTSFVFALAYGNSTDGIKDAQITCNANPPAMETEAPTEPLTEEPTEDMPDSAASSSSSQVVVIFLGSLLSMMLVNLFD